MCFREEQYRTLWGELETLGQAYSSSSDRHHILSEFISKTMVACPSYSAQHARKIATPAAKQGGRNLHFPPNLRTSYFLISKHTHIIIPMNFYKNFFKWAFLEFYLYPRQPITPPPPIPFPVLPYIYIILCICVCSCRRQS